MLFDQVFDRREDVFLGSRIESAPLSPGSDYTALSGTVTIPANSTSATIDVSVLDDTILSAPVIREPILGGSGQISGNFSVESAQI